MESIVPRVPQPPAGPCPAYSQRPRPGVRYVRRTSLPLFGSNDQGVSGISKHTTKSSSVVLRERPATPTTTAANDPVRHTAKSLARAAFLDGERGKFEEMFPPLGKAAAVHPKTQGTSQGPGAQSLKRDESKSSMKSASSTTNAATRTLSYSEVTRGVPSGSKQATLQLTSHPEQKSPQGVVSETHQPEVPCKEEADTNGAPGGQVAPHQQASPLVEQQPHPEVEQPQPGPETMHRYPHTVVMVPMHPVMQPMAGIKQCCPPMVPMVPLQQPYCQPVVLYSGVVQGWNNPGAVPQQLGQPVNPWKRQKRHQEEDFSTLLAKRKEEYARVRAKKEKFSGVLEELRHKVAVNQAIITSHPEQVAKVILRKSVAVEEAYEAQQRGDQKREFDVLQAHLEDLSFNKAQVIAELENEEKEKKSPEKELKEEIEKLNDNDETIIERTVEIVRDMLNKAAMSDEEDDDDEEEEVGEEEEDDEEEDSEEEEEDSEEDEEEQEDDEDSEDENGDVSALASVLSPPDTTLNMENKEASESLDDSSYSSSPLSFKNLEKLSGNAEDDIQEDMAKFGRLMRLEAAINGKNNTNFLDRLTSLLEGMEIEHEDNQADSDESSSEAESSSESEGTAYENEETDPKPRETECNSSSDEEEEEPGHIMRAFTSTSISLKSSSSNAQAEETDHAPADPENVDSADEDEEEPGHIRRAFTSTSISLKSSSSNAQAEGMDHGPDSEEVTSSDEEEEYSGPILPAFTSTSINLSSADSEALLDELKSADSLPPENKKVTNDKLKVGRKRVSFSLDEDNASDQTLEKRCTSAYARMSAGNLGDLVSSALVSDIMTYAKPNSDLEDECSESSDRPVIAVKYISIVTTEKKKTKLRPAFAESSDTQHVLSFMIKGEILLSTSPVDTDSNGACSAVDPNPRLRPTTASTRRRGRREDGGDEAVKEVVTTYDSSDICRVTEESSETQEGEPVDGATEGSSEAQESQQDTETAGELGCTDSSNVCEVNEESSEAEESGNGTKGVPGGAGDCQCTYCLHVYEVTEEPQMSKQDTEKVPGVESKPGTVGECECIYSLCLRKEAEDSSEAGESGLDTCDTSNETTDSEPVTAPITVNITPADDESSVVIEEPSSHVTATTEDNAPTSDTTPKEEAPAPYVYHLTTPSIFITTSSLENLRTYLVYTGSDPSLGKEDNKSPETTNLNTAGETVSTPAVPDENNGMEGGDEKGSESAADTSDATNTEMVVPDAPDVQVMNTSGGENAETAVMPYDSQIVTIKVLKALEKDEEGDEAAVNVSSQEEEATSQTETVAPDFAAGGPTEVSGGEKTETAVIPYNSQIVSIKVRRALEISLEDGAETAEENGETNTEPNSAAGGDASVTTDTGDSTQNKTETQRSPEQDVEESGISSHSDIQKEPSSQSEHTTTFLSKFRKSLASFRRCDLQEAVVPPLKQSADEKLNLRKTKSKPITIPVEPPREPLLPLRPMMDRPVLKPKKKRSGPLRANSQVVMEKPTDQRKHDGSAWNVMSSKAFRSHSSPAGPSMKDEHYSHASVTRSTSLGPATMEPMGNAVGTSRSASVYAPSKPLVASESFHSKNLKTNSQVMMQQTLHESASNNCEEMDGEMTSRRTFRSHSSPIAPSVKDEQFSHTSVRRGRSFEHTTSRSTSLHATTEPLVAYKSTSCKASSRSTMQQPSLQSVSETHEGVDLGTTSNNRFRSHSSPITPTMKDERYSYASVRRGKSFQPATTVDPDVITAVLRRDRSSRLPPLNAATPQEPLYKPRSLPGVFDQSGGHLSRRMKKSQSERISAVPKLPKL